MQSFVLIDTYPGMAEKVLRSLSKYPQIVKPTLVRDQNVDVLALVEGDDPDSIADYAASKLRFLEGVYTFRVVDDLADEDLTPVVRKAMLDLKK